MYNEIKKEVIELLKDKVTISWSYNKHLEDIFDKYELFDNQKVYLDITTNLCVELSEEFFAYQVGEDIIFSTRELEYYLHLGKLIDYLNNEEFTKEDMRKAIDSIGASFNGRPLSELPLDEIYKLVYNNDGLVRQSMFLVYGK